MFSLSQEKKDHKMSMELLDTEEAVEDTNSHEMKVSNICAVENIIG
jgi:hypothetical protein